MKYDIKWEIGGMVIMVVSALIAYTWLPLVEGIMETVITVITLVPFVIGGSLIYVGYKAKEQAIKTVVK
ncbi:hypothetical protein LCGC14_0373920 [marine sediment metagenome]|uniref:Uncharacterized protein n=1 Tax=marine sediment metagenome TaxID=412755 RepID=A0A0F9WCS4_9ZZZZ